VHKHVPALLYLFSSRVISSLRSVNFGSGRSNHRIKNVAKARVVLPSAAELLALSVLTVLTTQTARAQSNATWTGAVSTVFNIPGNWSPNTAVPTGVATFGPSAPPPTPITFSLPTSVDTLSFEAANYKFSLSNTTLTLTGSGILPVTGSNPPMFDIFSNAALRFSFGNLSGTSTAGNGIFNAHNGPTGFGGFIRFFGESTADNATIMVTGASNVEFHNSSTAGHATITSSSGGDITFNDMATGGNANITVNNGGLMELGLVPAPFNGGMPTLEDAIVTINNGGQARFFSQSTGGAASATIDEGGAFDISGLNAPGMTIGSIQGSGSIYLGSRKLTVGTNNTSTVFSGVIQDGTVFNPGNGNRPPGTSLTGGSLTKTGTGTLTLLGANTYSGGTTIQDGTLVVGTLIAADQPISTALGTGNVFVDPGTLRTTSASTGVPVQINVGGNYTQAAGGTLALGIGGLQGEQFDHVQVGGDASLSGNLIVSSLNSFHPSADNAFEVLHTNGTVHGNFSVLNDSAFNTTPGVITGHLELRPIEIVARNAVLLVYEKVPPTEEIPQPPPGGTEQPPVVDDPGITLPPVNPDEPLPEPEVVPLVDPTAEELTSLYQIGFSAENMQRFNLGDRMFQIQQSVVLPPPVPPYQPSYTKEGKEVEGKAPPAPPPIPINRWGVWAAGWGDFANVDSTSAAEGYRFVLGGVSAGVDYLVIPNHLAVGLFGGYSHSWINFTPSGSATANTGRGGLYVTYFDQGWWVDAAGWAGGTNYSTSRQGILGMATGNTSGWEASTFGEAGKDFLCGNFTFGPVVAMQYTNVHLNGFGENGSLVPLDIHGDSQDSLVTDVGGRAYYTWHGGNTTIIPKVELYWEHEYLYSNLPLTISAPGLDNATTTVSGPNVGHDSMIIDASLSIRPTSWIWLTIGYNGQVLRDHYLSNSVIGTLSFGF
jgi:autotransporter-associated beta strand protein